MLIKSKAPTAIVLALFAAYAVTAAGCLLGDDIETLMAKAGNGPVPGTPTEVNATAMSSNSIMVSWASVSGAADYYIYRSASASGVYSYLGSSSSTAYSDTGLSANTAYYYKVSASNSFGESAQSSYVSATTWPSGSGTAPSTPTGVSATAISSSSITVSWNAASGAIGYNIYRSTSDSGTYRSLGSTSSTAYSDTELSASTTYYYKVFAYNSNGGSAQSGYVSATTESGIVPDTPTGVTAWSTITSMGRITVSWNPVSEATGYKIYRSTSASGWGVYYYVGSTSSTAYTDTGLAAYTNYSYKVSAYNSYGESAQSSDAMATAH